MSSLIARLDAEWQHLAGSRATATTLAGWRRLEPVLAGHRDLESLRTVAHNRADPTAADALLAALTRLAAIDGHDQPLAARVILQLLLPGAIRLAGSLRGMLGTDAAGAVLGEVAIGARTYPWRRRPRAVAANLLLDARLRLTRRFHRHGRETPTGLVPDHDDCGTTVMEYAEATLAVHHLLAWAQDNGVLDAFETRLLIACHLQDQPISQLVTPLGTSRARLYTTHAAAVRRLRHALTTAGAARV
jgi:hypothetical protein